jgi:hypothetical protein
MFGENGFRYHGAHAAWFNETQDHGHQMDKEESQITHSKF